MTSVPINLSSIIGLTSLGLPQAACSASKALIGLTRDLAQQRTS
jgi:NAD(P)-dependent dehydrogenase (short-subunit alcohol dehydrogenase family)